MISAVSAVSAMSRPNSANGDGDGENDRKQCFHGYKIIVAASSCAFTDFRRDRRQQRRFSARENQRLNAAPTPTGFAEIFADDFSVTFQDDFASYRKLNRKSRANSSRFFAPGVCALVISRIAVDCFRGEFRIPIFDFFSYL